MPGDLDSESVVGTSRVAPQPSFSIQHTWPPGSLYTTGQPPGQHTDEDPGEVISDQYASILSELLNLCGVCTGGVWSPLNQKDNQIVHKIISVVAELIKVSFFVVKLYF